MIKKLMIIAVLLILSAGMVSANDNETADTAVMDNDVNAGEIDADSSDVKSFEDIQNTINIAPNNSTILLNGTYAGLKEIMIDKDLTIEGNGATLDAGHNSKILNIVSGNVVLKNINFINAKSETKGGAIFSNVDLTVINCSFIKNEVQSEYDWYFNTHNHNYEPEELGEGGAIYANNDLTIINASFIGNSAVFNHVERQMDMYYVLDYGDGGAILCKGKLYLEKSTLAIREVSCDKVNRHGIVEATQFHDNVYKISSLVEKPKADEAPSNLAVVARYILTPDIFDKISQTEPGFNGEIQLTDAISKLDEIYCVKFTGKVFNIENRLEWIKSSIDYAMADDEFKGDLISYMKTFVG